MNLNIGIISGVLSTSIALKKQLMEYSETFKDIELYGIEDYFPEDITCDLMIYSSDIVYNEIYEMNRTINAKEDLIASRTINFETVDDLFKIRKGEKVYVVNDAKVTTYQFIAHLKHIGLEDIEMVPYFPGTKIDKRIRYAISPGTIDGMPENIENMINIGPRLFGLETIHQILKAAGLLDSLDRSYSEKYLSKVVDITKRSGRYASEVMLLNERLNLIMSSIDEGVLVVDTKNKISLINKPLLELLNMPYRNFSGEGIDKVIRNQDIVDFCIGIKQSQEDLFTINHVNLLFSRQKLSSGDIIVFVKNIEERILESNRFNQELVKKGHIGKYTFEHILGTSPAIMEAKYIAHKLAKSELTILIEGESGTGKELFASAIHNASNRADKAYLAINFSAFTDELIESELFGYEDGAFTGAKKGGKVGLFELANGGTLLLDEIGDISPKMQTKLLRVLQEGEIIRIGGTIIKSVDVRIIAATNKNLRQMVERGEFREDLYYRLKMGTVNLPPLRERRKDIPLLIEHFLLGEYEITKEAEGILTQKTWQGNIRELKGSIEYMKAISEGNLLSEKTLPKSVEVKSRTVSLITDQEYHILELVYKCNKQGISCGRQNIQTMTYDQLGLTENQIRARIKKLVQKGYLSSSKGRAGSFVTDEGIRVLDNHLLTT
ncbi:Fis family transcriptional regulator [Acidaminobacter sp. JC074]|uniref:sigma-54 interaction domain-containing protein n=1 Tax=Acidaminobacter sp. JC074 TaxID=2530199 RepID=UPI001F107325|nr:sigma 54-interacting transcriptional regulator [Acidaminobacter sp. JC074]MCH4890866.1 Fis family transcriptional regulator [Acidaminobacter sp. JC074]